MANYTLVLRDILRSLIGEFEESDSEKIIVQARPLVFNFAYPAFSAETDKIELERDILRTYYMQEICVETYEYWKHLLRVFLYNKMPAYVAVYNALHSDLDLFASEWTTREIGRESSDSGSSNKTASGEERTSNAENTTTQNSGTQTGTSNSTGWNLYSDTPQGSIQNLDDESYLTNATKDTQNTSTNANSNSSSQTNSGSNTTLNRSSSESLKSLMERAEKTLEKVQGRGGKYGYELLADYNNKVVNLCNQIVTEAQNLFMGVW